MPILNVTVSGASGKPNNATIAKTLSGLTRQHLRKDPQLTSVAITSIPAEDWFVGGASLAGQRKSSFWLDIKVVDGTNTKQELAAYIAAVFAAMSDLLGDVHTESYVLVHEVPASAYGYGGKTQEHRYVAGQMQAAA